MSERDTIANLEEIPPTPANPGSGGTSLDLHLSQTTTQVSDHQAGVLLLSDSVWPHTGFRFFCRC